jgi:hypothetical protein
MNARDYRLHLDGREAAARGAGLSDSPHGGRDGDLWRGGVRSWLDEHPDPDGDETDETGSGRPPAQKTTLYDGPGRAISTRPLCLYGRKTGSEWKSGKVETWRPAQARP